MKNLKENTFLDLIDCRPCRARSVDEISGSDPSAGKTWACLDPGVFELLYTETAEPPSASSRISGFAFSYHYGGDSPGVNPLLCEDSFDEAFSAVAVPVRFYFVRKLFGMIHRDVVDFLYFQPDRLSSFHQLTADVTGGAVLAFVLLFWSIRMMN